MSDYRAVNLANWNEHDSVPWNPLEAGVDGKYRLGPAPERLAATYALQATKALPATPR